MSVERIREALKPLGIPVTALQGDTRAQTYAVITEILEQPEQCADNREIVAGYYAQIDFISKKNINEMVRRATRLLADAGIIRQNKRTEFVTEAKVFRHSIRVLLVYETEGEENGG